MSTFHSPLSLSACPFMLSCLSIYLPIYFPSLSISYLHIICLSVSISVFCLFTLPLISLCPFQMPLSPLSPFSPLYLCLLTLYSVSHFRSSLSILPSEKLILTLVIRLKWSKYLIKLVYKIETVKPHGPP